MSGDRIDLFSVVGANGEARSRWLAVELGPAAVGDEVRFKTGLRGLLQDRHQFVFRVHSAADFSNLSLLASNRPFSGSMVFLPPVRWDNAASKGQPDKT